MLPVWPGRTRYPEVGFCAASEEDKQCYYAAVERDGITMEDSLEWDQQVVNQVGRQGGPIRPASWRRFLLGGCATVKTLQAMERFICWLDLPEPAQLLVVDGERQALSRLEKVPPVPGVTRLLMQANLLHVPPMSPFDFVRMDFLQNFVPPDYQPRLLQQLASIVPTTGIIASSVSMVARAFTGEESTFLHPRGERLAGWSGRGCRVHYDLETQMSTVDLTLSCLETAATSAGLSMDLLHRRDIEEEDLDSDQGGWMCYEEAYLWFHRCPELSH